MIYTIRLNSDFRFKPSIIKTKDGMIYETTKALEGFNGKPIDSLIFWLQQNNIKWKVMPERGEKL